MGATRRWLALFAPILLLLAAGCASQGGDDAAAPAVNGPALVVLFTDN